MKSINRQLRKITCRPLTESEAAKHKERHESFLKCLKPSKPYDPGTPMRGYFCGDSNEPRVCFVRDGMAYMWLGIEEMGRMAGLSDEQAASYVNGLPVYDKPLMM